MTLKANEGVHLIIELAGCDRSILNNRSIIRRFLNETPAKIGMRLLSPAKVVYCNAEDSIDSGISGFSIIEESHLACHTWPERGGYIQIDISSCRDFNEIEVRDYLISFFKAKVYDERVVKRGSLMDWYKDNL